MSGNWAGTFVRTGLGADALQASIALTAFWAAVTLGRVGFAALESIIPGRWTYRIIPLVVAVAYLAAVPLPADRRLSRSSRLPWPDSAALHCCRSPSVLAKSNSLQASHPVPLIATYQVGYGIAAFGVGPLLSGGVTLGWIFAASGVVAVAVSVLAFVSTSRTINSRRVVGN